MTDWDKLLNIGSQLPVVMIFIFFVVYWTDRMAKSQKDHDMALTEAIKSIVTAIERLETNFEKHNQEMHEAVVRMDERSGVRRTTRGSTQKSGD